MNGERLNESKRYWIDHLESTSANVYCKVRQAKNSFEQQTFMKVYEVALDTLSLLKNNVSFSQINILLQGAEWHLDAAVSNDLSYELILRTYWPLLAEAGKLCQENLVEFSFILSGIQDNLPDSIPIYHRTERNMRTVAREFLDLWKEKHAKNQSILDKMSLYSSLLEEDYAGLLRREGDSVILEFTKSLCTLIVLWCEVHRASHEYVNVLKKVRLNTVIRPYFNEAWSWLNAAHSYIESQQTPFSNLPLQAEKWAKELLIKEDIWKMKVKAAHSCSVYLDEIRTYASEASLDFMR